MSVRYMLGLRIPDWGALGALILTVGDARVAATVGLVIDDDDDDDLVVVVAVDGFVVEVTCFLGTALGTGAKRDFLGTVSFLALPVRGAGLMGMMAFFTDAKLCLVTPVFAEVEGATVDVVAMRDFDAFGVFGVPRFTRPWNEGRRDFLVVVGFLTVDNKGFCFTAVDGTTDGLCIADIEGFCFAAVEVKMDCLDSADTDAVC